MTNLLKQKTAASKLMEFEMVQHVANDIAHRGHPDHGERQAKFQGQGKILLTLNQEDGLSQKELATRLNLTAQSTAEFVNKLVKKQFVTKEKSATDRRVSIIRITPEGRQAAVHETSEIPPFLNALTDEELNQLTSIFTKINTSLYDEINEANPTWYNRFHQSFSNHFRDWFL
ncbi:MarR family winged helix-turn-helix transcriptional regulator [Lactiplantibacillus herbarum]|uniref:MarR family winged helix-turn-helix transcriptional regulator n=1 Tax=Lactiplantibacillus herbarum TaxID=1670446 RepID=UPI00064E382A|nr:MarR family transcriptional regulator [Lactiplantibacillus herbarum]